MSMLINPDVDSIRGATSADEGERILGRTWLVSPRCDVVFGNARLRRQTHVRLYDESVIKEYYKDDALFILPAGLGPDKSRQDDLKQLLTSANRPQCNGKNERVNQTLVAKLRCKVNSTTKTPWTKLLEQVTYEYNNSPHDVTGFPPAYLMFGTLPYDSPLPNQVKLNYPPIQQARQIAVNRTIKHHKINKQRYDRHYVDAKFKVGDLVLYQNFSYPNSSKLQSPYNGPFKVVRKLSNVTYEIDKPNQYTGKLTDIVHSTRLKPFHSKSNFQLC
ncbi:retrotransposable element Tf2 protein type 3 [Trichonephila clavipes]|nr:retrotransposable element Tf2 protein type 3 [Trichonephila clavipes]